MKHQTTDQCDVLKAVLGKKFRVLDAYPTTEEG